jgi:hypothetical protein
MSVRKMILKDTGGGTELVFPVTPSEFRVSFGRNVLKVNIHQMGDVNFWGQAAAAEIALSVLFPSGDRSYAFSGGVSGDPYGAIERLQNWQTQGAVLRYIVSDTPVNMAVLLSRVEYGEQDGTGDVYAELTLSEYRELGSVRVDTTGTGIGSASSSARSSESGGTQKGEQVYTVVKGDTLWAIARKYYGNAELCWRLASYNGIKNANLIFPGQTVRLPDKGAL